MAVLEIKNLTFSYPSSDNNALSGINLSVNEGEFCLVIGRSGSGKSTLLRLLKKEIAPFGKIDGEINLCHDKIGFVSQDIESNIVTETVRGELAFAPENMGAPKNKINLKIAEIANYFSLGGVINNKIETLSGGMKQMAALASVMTAEPKILVLDEPTSQLDPVSAENFINKIVKLNKEQGITVILSEHKIDNILPLADKIIVLDGGKVAFCGAPNEAVNFLIDTDNELCAMLPTYTLALLSHPISFADAKKHADEITPKSNITYQKREPALTAKSISFAYGRGQRDVFFSLDYAAEKGKINAIIGANGSGKTTLLKCFSKIYKCYSGKIKACGKTAYMPQNVKTLFLFDTVGEEVSSIEILNQFSLGGFENQNPFDLSGGEAQRLALAKIISIGADIILLDEPTKSIDCVFKTELAEILKSLANSGKTIIFATHDLEFAGRYADNVSFLFDGEIITSAPRREFFSSLDVYTTALSRLTSGTVVSLDDIEVAP